MRPTRTTMTDAELRRRAVEPADDKLGWIDWCDAESAEVLHVAQEGGGE